MRYVNILVAIFISNWKDDVCIHNSCQSKSRVVLLLAKLHRVGHPTQFDSIWLNKLSYKIKVEVFENSLELDAALHCMKSYVLQI